MGQGTLRIEVATLRKLLPMWLRAAGFVLTDEWELDGGGRMLVVDVCVEGHGREVLEGYIGSMLRGLTVIDGGVWYGYNKTSGLMYVKVAGSND